MGDTVGRPLPFPRVSGVTLPRHLFSHSSRPSHSLLSLTVEFGLKPLTLYGTTLTSRLPEDL